MSRQIRTDCHRPGSIVPAHYEHVLSYNLPSMFNGGFKFALGIDCVRDKAQYDFHPDGSYTFVAPGEHRGSNCCLTKLHENGAVFAESMFENVDLNERRGAGRCSVCGASFVYGDCYRHVPTGEYVHMGHDCSDKYAMLYNRSAWELANDRAEQAIAVRVLKAKNAEERVKFLALHEGLAEALQQDHSILRDLSQKLTQYHTLSPKQIAFAFKLADEVKNPKPEEAHVVAPLGKGIEFEGEVVSLKSHESDFGPTLKMTVKVSTDKGT